MKSLGSRLALWYAGAATLTMFCLSVAGYYLLAIHLVRGLDLLNTAQFEQIKAHLGSEYDSLNADIIEARIRETTNYSSVLFFITVDDRNGPVRPIFYSNNLRGHPIPDVPGKRLYDARLMDGSEIRAAEFILGPFDVTIATPSNSVTAALRDYSKVCAWLLAVMTAISVAIGFGLSHLALRPVRLIRETATRISSDNLSERIPIAQVHDEIAELALLLNKMFSRLETAFDQTRRFSAEASHELKTPLSLIRLQAEKLLELGQLDATGEEAVHQQLEEVARLSRIIEELLFLSRAEAREIELPLAAADPQTVLNNFINDATVLSEHRGIHYVHSHAGAGRVLAEPRWVRRVLLNLLSNALDASPNGATIKLESKIDESAWQVSLEDQGVGVPAEFQDSIFERFFRLPGQSQHTGSGLGLAICKSIITLHRGRIWAESRHDSPGLRVVFSIPTVH